MSEETLQNAVDACDQASDGLPWLRAAIVAVAEYTAARYGLAPKPQPAPAKCVECGGVYGGHLRVEDEGPGGVCTRPCSRATPPSAKGAAETMPVAVRIALSGEAQYYVAWWSASADTDGVTHIRKDEVERRVAEAIEFGKACRKALREILLPTTNESLTDAARRVVAERDAWKSAAEQHQQARNAEFERGVALAEECHAEKQRSEAAQAKARELEEHNTNQLATIGSYQADFAAFRARAETAEMRVRELEAQRDELLADKESHRERAETAERDLSVARDDYRKACDELRLQQTKTVEAERELGEARTHLRVAHKHIEGVATDARDTAEWVKDRVKP